jgi:hypothetical protein
MFVPRFGLCLARATRGIELIDQHTVRIREFSGNAFPVAARNASTTAPATKERPMNTQ